jgi:hypothetical protein
MSWLPFKFPIRLWLALWLILPPVLSEPSYQAEPIELTINGRPRINGAEVQLNVSVHTPGAALLNLPAAAFTVQQANQPVNDLQVNPAAVGLAAVVVIDRGGIAAQNGCLGATGRSRISEAKELAATFIEQLLIGVPDLPEDMIALVGVGTQDGANLTEFRPDQNFIIHPVDRNLVLNMLDPIDTPDYLLAENATTPLYEGLDHALDWLLDNNNPAVREELTRRQKFILTFSDGIDREYSDDAIEVGIIQKARENNVHLYSVGMACDSGGSQLEPDSLRHMASQTGGLYWPHTTANEHEQLLAAFPGLLSYRQQYQLTFTTHLPAGEYTLLVQAEANGATGEDSARFVSQLQPPQIVILYPPEGYQLEHSAALSTTLPVTVEATFSDSISRNLMVEFLVNGTPVYSQTVPPYHYDWNLAGLPAANHVIRVRAQDTLLRPAASMEAVRTIEILAPTPVPVPTDTPRPPSIVPPVPGSEDTGAVSNLLLWFILPALITIAVLALALTRTRRQLASVVTHSARQVGRSMTRLLSSANRPTFGRLTVTRGANVNRQYPLRETTTRFGREAGQCDEVIQDGFISGCHFSISYDPNQSVFFIIDHGSRNRTFVNGHPLSPNQYIPLHFGNFIRLGETELLFEPPAATTRRLFNNP